jgi:hypothetical protein
MSIHHSKTSLARSILLAIGMCTGVTVAASACLDRPLAPQQPVTSRQSVKVLPNNRIDKIDLLFMIDSSSSMADKQKILAEAVPDLLSRLTQPDCIQFETGEKIPGNTVATCPSGYFREFKPVEDIRIGVLSSSLEMPGSDTCTKNPDVGLLTRKPGESGLGADIEERRFIQWNPKDPQGSTSLFADLVRGVGESGCGYESSLESWYRFLVDPAPPSTWVPVPCDASENEQTKKSCRVAGDPDPKILEQRKAFLRPDSLLAIILLSDENDCSINPHGQGWVAGADGSNLGRGTAACATDPDSPDCRPCADTTLDKSKYPECNEPLPKPDADYNNNLRCWDQKRRFGMDLLHPVSRYVRALTETHIDGKLNPIFCPEPDPSDPTGQTCTTPLRPKDFVFLGGIVGVPWQDIANDPKDLGKGYRPAEQYGKTASVLEAEGFSAPGGVSATTTLWDVILGPTRPDHARVGASSPLDPLMRESVVPREGTNPALGLPLAGPDALDPRANPINGHEWNAELDFQPQFACIFDLPEVIECTPGDWKCDCSNPEGKNNPLCQDTQGNYSRTQRRAKAYPGLRQLSVLKGIGSQGIAASICPATMDANRSDYGYRPAVSAIVDRLAQALSGTCWDEQLEPDAEGNVPCVVLEATRGTSDASGQVACEPCEGIRRDPSPASWTAVSSQPLFKENSMNCLCEVGQADAGSGALQACIEEPETSPADEGWCYVDPTVQEKAAVEVLGSCRRMIRFVGEPRANSLTFIQCKGATF